MPGSLAQLNFMNSYNCIGMHEYFDSTNVSKMVVLFEPSLVILNRIEFSTEKFQAILRELSREGFECTIADQTELATYI